MEGLRRVCGPALILLLCAAAASVAGDGLPPRPKVFDRIATPPGAVITYCPEKETCFLGEPVQVILRIENKGEETLEYLLGGDYRGSDREHRFTFIATDSAGKRVPEPPPWSSMGGLSGANHLDPGESREILLPLFAWCEFRRPGTYTVHAGQDIGWDPPAEELSSDRWKRSEGGSFTITLLEPSPEDCAGIVDDLVDQAVDARYDEFWKLRQFSYLRYPGYLDPLAALASHDNPAIRRAAADGLASIWTPGATAALIDTLRDRDATVVRAAAWALRDRLPEDPGVRIWMDDPARLEAYKKRRREITERCWREEFAPEIVEYAVGFLRTANADLVSAGADFLRMIGNSESVVTLVRALEREALKVEKAEGTWPVMYSPQKQAADRALRAITTIVEREGRLPFDGPRTFGESIAWVVVVGGVDSYRPEGWQDVYLRCLRSDRKILLLRSLWSLPEDLAPMAADDLVRLASSTDPEVRQAAFSAASRWRIGALLPAALQEVAGAKDEEILESAAAVCDRLGDMDHINMLIDRLTDRDVAPMAHRLLYSRTAPLRAWSRSEEGWKKENLAELQQAWRTWFDENGKTLEELGPLPLDDPRLPARPHAEAGGPP